MLSEFLDKTTALFDRGFLLAYWYPTLLSLSVGLLLFSWPKSWEPLNQYYAALQSDNYSSILMIILGTILLTLFLAHLFQAFSHMFVQFWEGYWPESLWSWHKSENDVVKKWEQLKNARDIARRYNLVSHSSFQEQLFYEYPSQKDRLLPTQLGNVLRAAEDYAETAYGMDAVFWWPRLWLFLPETVRQQIDDSLAPMLAFLNLATQLAVVSFAGFIYLCWQYTGPWKSFAFLAASVTFIVGITLTALAYQGAVSQAKVYGILIRSVIDIYRFDLLKALHQSIPSDLAEEKQLWDNLIRWLYLNEQDNAPPYSQDQSKS